MQVDDQLVGFTDKLQLLVSPMSELATDRFTTVLSGVYDGQVALVQYQQSTATRNGDLEQRMADLRARYDDEMAHAQAQARECAAAALTSHANAERYAQMTTILGSTATMELQ